MSDIRDTDPAPAPDEEITKTDHTPPTQTDPERFASIVGNMLRAHLEPIERAVMHIADRQLEIDEAVRKNRDEIRATKGHAAQASDTAATLLRNQEEVLGKIRPLVENYGSLREDVATLRDLIKQAPHDAQ